VSAGFRRASYRQKTYFGAQKTKEVGFKKEEEEEKTKNVGENARLTCNVQVER